MKKFIIPTIALMAVGVLGITQASAATPATTPAQIISKSDTAIASRITSLNKLSAKIATFKHLTSSQQASLNATVQSSITAMNALKTKIDGETDLATLKTDYASITKDYRIYMLVMPSTTDIAATDNAMSNIATYQTTLGTLQTRIATATAAGKNTATVQSAYTDATTKLAAASAQAQVLINAVTALRPDMGSKTVEASNKTAVSAAKTARKTLLSDISSAHTDIASIRTGLKILKV